MAAAAALAASWDTTTAPAVAANTLAAAAADTEAPAAALTHDLATGGRHTILFMKFVRPSVVSK
jgi:hypothetical protein